MPARHVTRDNGDQTVPGAVPEIGSISRPDSQHVQTSLAPAVSVCEPGEIRCPAGPCCRPGYPRGRESPRGWRGSPAERGAARTIPKRTAHHYLLVDARPDEVIGEYKHES
ncbi:hypothetical protein BaRGS_00023313, partial [Batillaria attramentaria]